VTEPDVAFWRLWDAAVAVDRAIGATHLGAFLLVSPERLEAFNRLQDALRGTEPLAKESPNEAKVGGSPSTGLTWRQCACGSWYWGAAQTDADIRFAPPVVPADRLAGALEQAMNDMRLEGNRPNRVYAAELADRIRAAKALA
jgi:hypothetical protein